MPYPEMRLTQATKPRCLSVCSRGAMGPAGGPGRNKRSAKRITRLVRVYLRRREYRDRRRALDRRSSRLSEPSPFPPPAPPGFGQARAECGAGKQNWPAQIPSRSALTVFQAGQPRLLCIREQVDKTGQPILLLAVRRDEVWHYLCVVNDR
jgi:hypothetical protein